MEQMQRDRCGLGNDGKHGAIQCDKLMPRIIPMRWLARGRTILTVFLLAPLLAVGRGSGGAASPVTHVDHGPNSARAQAQHFVLLVLLEGLRWDYAQRDGARNLLALGKAGVSAPKGMNPSYPPLSFPNGLSIVTGLYPEHHGIVADNFFDPARKARFSSSDPEAESDGTWYSGTPLWSLAESQGMRTACLFWPGSEAKIAGFRPTYYVRAGGEIDDEARVRQALEWLQLPAAYRPHLIALSFSELDREGRQFGPEAQETKAAMLKMDALVGQLKAGLDATGLPIDLVVVGDHGMARSEGGWIALDQFTGLTGFDTDGAMLYGQSEAERENVYNQLKQVSSLFVVYRRRNVPPQLHYRQNARVGDPVVFATGPYAIRAGAPGAGMADRPPSAGLPGFDPGVVPEMKAGFYAAGADIVVGATVAPFENVNLYPWLAHLLGLTTPRTDGDLNILSGTLRDGGGAATQ